MLQHVSYTGSDYQAYNTIHVGGSLGTYKQNPSAKFYIMDKIENIPLFAHTFIYNLD